ncbi:hypothetical protein LUW77_12700 [Streptomyces radiopugnans]|nr:hypothetical protein LUW77_12700 [Streptomyces radiopugnans]
MRHRHRTAAPARGGALHRQRTGPPRRAVGPRPDPRLQQLRPDRRRPRRRRHRLPRRRGRRRRRRPAHRHRGPARPCRRHRDQRRRQRRRVRRGQGGAHRPGGHRAGRRRAAGRRGRRRRRGRRGRRGVRGPRGLRGRHRRRRRAAVPRRAPHGPPPAHVEFRRLAMQPGKPQGFGLVGPDRIPLFALPGNPVSSYVSFELFVRPALRALMGLEPVTRRTVTARLECEEPIASPEGKRQFLRGRYRPPAAGEEHGTVRPVGGPGSHLLGSLARADALVVVPERTTEVARGDELEVVLLD